MQKNFDALTFQDLEKLPVNHFLTYQIHHLHMAFNRQGVALLKKVSGLRLNEWRVLSMIGLGYTTNNAELHRMLGFDRSIVSRAMRALELQGLITVTRATEDRRRLNIKLTSQGEQIYRKTLPVMRKRQMYLLSALDEAEQAVFFSIIEKLKTAAEHKDF